MTQSAIHNHIFTYKTDRLFRSNTMITKLSGVLEEQADIHNIEIVTDGGLSVCFENVCINIRERVESQMSPHITKFLEKSYESII